MSLLKPAIVEQAAAKIGTFGRQGSGKTTTNALIAIGLSKTFHQNAPVAFLDTENGSDYLVPIFEAEGVPLLVVKSRAFKDMRQACSEAEAGGCCVYMVDSYTHPWTELTDSFKAKSRRKKLEFHHMDELKGYWRGWTDQMLNSPLHILLAGRLGFEWDREEGEDGAKGDLIKLGSKMKGEAEAGYEPSLLIEIEGIQEAEGRMKNTRAKKSSIVHHAYVLKDRWRVLNGRSFSFKDINVYKPGDWKPVFNAFKPHFDRLAIGTQTQRATNPTRTSEGMFDGAGDEGWRRKKDIALDEIRESIVAVWPGQTSVEKRFKQVALEVLFQTSSWVKVESLRIEQLEPAALVMIEFKKKALADRSQIENEAAIAALFDVCRSVVADTAALAQDAAQEAVGF